MHILVTGGTGFIGSHLVKRLLHEGHHVTALSRNAKAEESTSLRVIRGDLTDARFVRTLDGCYDTVVHNAGAVGAHASHDNGREFVDTNVGGTNSLAKYLAGGKHKVKQLIVGSSISVYGEGSYLCKEGCGLVRPGLRQSCDLTALAVKKWNPLCPDCSGELEPMPTPETAARNGMHLYALTKKYQEDALTQAAERSGIDLTIFRYATVYGEGQALTSTYMRILANMVEGNAPHLFEDGLQSRDFIHVKDVVDVNVLALNKRLPGLNTFNIGYGQPLALSTIIQKLSEKVQTKYGIKVAPPEIKQVLVPGDVRHCNIDCSAAADRLSFAPQVGLDVGLGALVDWYAGRTSSSLH